MSDKRYKYQLTKQKLSEIITHLADGEPLPNRNELAKQCGVARVTLERAISEMIGEGLLISYDGRGTYKTGKFGGAAAPRGGESVLDETTWALLVYSVTEGTAPTIVRGVEDFAHQHGVNLIVCNTDNDPQKEIEYLQRLHDLNISGIIIVPSTRSAPNWTIFDALNQKGISVVACSREVPGYDYPGAFQNFYQSGFVATQHLFQQGCKRVAYFAVSHYSTIEGRVQGYLAALNWFQSQYPGEPAHEEMGLLNIDYSNDIEEAIESFLLAHPSIDGIYIFSDRLALKLYSVMRKMNLVPGKDIYVVACDDSGFCASLSVPLSTIDFPAYDMSTIVAQKLYNIRNKLPGISESRHIVLNSELHVRKSSSGE